MKSSAHVYTAWAAMEYKKAGDVRRARNLFKLALKADKQCSAAWLQLGVMEGNNENWDQAELCFETVLKFDQRNSRVLQAYAIMESKRPNSMSRKVIGLFERALKVNPRDAGVLQPYALFVAELDDIDAARDL
jgi:Tfp pilus assembly protein PilF